MAEILINMETPESCSVCKYAVDAYGSLTEAKCEILGYGIYKYTTRGSKPERHEDCPLPHGLGFGDYGEQAMTATEALERERIFFSDYAEKEEQDAYGRIGREMNMAIQDDIIERERNHNIR